MEKDRLVAQKLSRLYIAALTVIAVLVISGQLLLQNALNRQIDDSRVVNIAGRQRMLSQKLVKEAMKVRRAQTEPLEERYQELAATLDLWQKSYNGLLHGDSNMGLPGTNSQTVLQMFKEIEQPFYRVVEAAGEILQTRMISGIAPREETVRLAVDKILEGESLFLEGMDRIVFQYDKEAKARVEHSKTMEQLLTWAALFVLFLEGFFVFRPAVRKLFHTLTKLEEERKKAEILAEELQFKNQKLDEVLNEILEISEQERRRIAQDLHDRLGQEIAGISCLTKALQKDLESKQIAESVAVAEVNQLITQAKAHTREIARGLYPIPIDGDGLVDKLRDLSASIEKLFQVQCRLTSPGHPLPVGAQHATHLYCIIQEAIRNSIRHGKAKSIWIAVYEKGKGLGISVMDDGAGFPSDQGEQGLGLRIMKYRSELINGQLLFSKNQLGGATVTCEIPSRDSDDKSD